MAILASLVGFGHLVQGFASCQLVDKIAVLLDAPSSTLPSAAAQT
jgi:hypothetical protein